MIAGTKINGKTVIKEVKIVNEGIETSNPNEMISCPYCHFMNSSDNKKCSFCKNTIPEDYNGMDILIKEDLKATIEIESTITGRRIFRDVDITGLSLEKTLSKICDNISRTHNGRLISIIFSEDSTESEIIEGSGQ